MLSFTTYISAEFRIQTAFSKAPGFSTLKGEHKWILIHSSDVQWPCLPGHHLEMSSYGTLQGPGVSLHWQFFFFRTAYIYIKKPPRHQRKSAFFVLTLNSLSSFLCHLKKPHTKGKLIHTPWNLFFFFFFLAKRWRERLGPPHGDVNQPKVVLSQMLRTQSTFLF